MRINRAPSCLPSTNRTGGAGAWQVVDNDAFRKKRESKGMVIKPPRPSGNRPKEKRRNRQRRESGTVKGNEALSLGGPTRVFKGDTKNPKWGYAMRGEDANEYPGSPSN